MRSPLSFEIEKRDDLLVWSDLFEEMGEPAYAECLRKLHAENRWPRKSGSGYIWSTFRMPVRTYPYLEEWLRRRLRYRFRLCADEWGFDRSAWYPNLTLAFLDAVSRRVWAMAAKGDSPVCP